MKRLCAVLCLILLLCGCAPRQELYSSTYLDLFDTAANIQGYAESRSAWEEQVAALHSDLLYYHKLFDIYHHYDGMVNLYDVNRQAAAGPVAVDDALYDFLIWCKQTVYPATHGATNIAAGAVLSLWHDARESDSPAPPPDDALNLALQHIAMENLLLDDEAHTVQFADADMALDVGAVAKGYAVEQAAESAEARGLTSAFLNVGGNLRAIGTKPGGSPWTAGVENPWGDDPAYLQAVSLQDGDSLIVSGDYQRYFTYNGVRYAHLIDLTTAQPARYYSSVAVLVHGAAGGMGDALSTALFCLPPEESHQLAEQTANATVLWMLPDGTTQAEADWPGEAAA